MTQVRGTMDMAWHDKSCHSVAVCGAKARKYDPACAAAASAAGGAALAVYSCVEVEQGCSSCV